MIHAIGNSYTYPLIHFRTSDSWKSSFPSFLLHLNSPLVTDLRIVDGLSDTSLETWFILRNLFEKLPSSFFSILSSCSLIGRRSVVAITTPLICFYNYLRNRICLYIVENKEFAPPVNWSNRVCYREEIKLYHLSQ